MLLSPLLVAAIPVLALLDLARGRPRLPAARLAAFGVWYLAWEFAAICSAAALWVAGGFGRRLGSPASLRRHRRLQDAWVASLLRAARRFLGLRLEIEGADLLGDGPLIVLCRHASLLDTLIPARMIFDRGLGVRYVLKDELLWDPALDLIGHRLPNYFVDRDSPDPIAETAAIGGLAAGAGADDALVIFPEGTRWAPGKRERAIASLRATSPERADRAAANPNTLPPRPGGTLALLDGCPDADVAVVAHTGLEGLSGPKEAMSLLPLRRPVRVSVRRIARADVPADPDGRLRWLLDQWDLVDAWVGEHSTTA